MKRRQAILTGIGMALTAVASYSYYDWIKVNKTPDLTYLDKNLSSINLLAEVVIPSCPEAPGAQEVEVGSIVLSLVKNTLPVIEQNRFIEGLKSMEKKSKLRYNKELAALDAEQAQSLLQIAQSDSIQLKGLLGKAQVKFLGRSFFPILKDLVIIGYCTSEMGAQKGLAYQYLPGQYIGCVTLSKNQKSWSTK